MRRLQSDTGSLAAELARLSELGRKELVERWRGLYGNNPPPNMSQQFLVRAIAYKMQENTFGGLKPAIRRFLAQVVKDTAAGQPLSAPPVTIKPGTRLIREWHGKTYEVEITATGALFQGKQYRSLSEIARIITGVKWSGPLFFGLKGEAI